VDLATRVADQAHAAGASPIEVEKDADCNVEMSFAAKEAVVTADEAVEGFSSRS
jgi:hypothetical protein